MVAESVIDLLRTMRRSKARLVAASGSDVESVTRILLRTVADDGPMRASALAATVHSDLSTVSRQVSALVADGLLERRADQLDGRASLLAITDAGRAALAENELARAEFFEHVLEGWSVEERKTFAAFLQRFANDYDRTHIEWMDRAHSRTTVGSPA